MRAIRIAEGTWRPNGCQLFHFGTYRVPEDMPAELARQAVAEGVATVVEEGAASAATTSAPPAARRSKKAILK